MEIHLSRYLRARVSSYILLKTFFFATPIFTIKQHQSLLSANYISDLKMCHIDDEYFEGCDHHIYGKTLICEEQRKKNESRRRHKKVEEHPEKEHGPSVFLYEVRPNPGMCPECIGRGHPSTFQEENFKPQRNRSVGIASQQPPPGLGFPAEHLRVDWDAYRTQEEESSRRITATAPSPRPQCRANQQPAPSTPRAVPSTKPFSTTHNHKLTSDLEKHPRQRLPSCPMVCSGNPDPEPMKNDEGTQHWRPSTSESYALPRPSSPENSTNSLQNRTDHGQKVKQSLGYVHPTHDRTYYTLTDTQATVERVDSEARRERVDKLVDSLAEQMARAKLGRETTKQLHHTRVAEHRRQTSNDQSIVDPSTFPLNTDWEDRFYSQAVVDPNCEPWLQEQPELRVKSAIPKPLDIKKRLSPRSERYQRVQDGYRNSTLANASHIDPKSVNGGRTDEVIYERLLYDDPREQFELPTVSAKWSPAITLPRQQQNRLEDAAWKERLAKTPGKTADWEEHLATQPKSVQNLFPRLTARRTDNGGRTEAILAPHSGQSQRPASVRHEHQEAGDSTRTQPCSLVRRPAMRKPRPDRLGRERDPNQTLGSSSTPRTRKAREEDVHLATTEYPRQNASRSSDEQASDSIFMSPSRGPMTQRGMMSSNVPTEQDPGNREPTKEDMSRSHPWGHSGSDSSEASSGKESGKKAEKRRPSKLIFAKRMSSGNFSRSSGATTPSSAKSWFKSKFGHTDPDDSSFVCKDAAEIEGRHK